LAFVRELLLADALRYSPGRLRDQPVKRGLELRGRLVGFAGNDLAAVDMLPVAPKIQQRRGGVDVDSGLRRIALQPAEALHRDRELAGAGGRPCAQCLDSLLAENAIGFRSRV